ncbi:F-box/kelch-repeat protein At3g23880-like, partial [Capsicum annuum]|uniref:F-box/kelch-repeat protein At3g23880-like n=1 Tax=Capsicum annuum TaxID=4072 RepID=UPI001FB0C792
MENEEDKAYSQHQKWKKRTKSAGFPSNSMQDLNFTIPLEIQVLSLLQFRCVSKSWLALISSPEFIQTHLSSYTEHRVMWNSIQGVNIKDCNLDSLFNDSVMEVSDLGHRMISDGLYNELPSCITILSSVNGLICLVDSKYNFFLWNPSNRKYKKLPCPRATLWFDKALMYGFGYDKFHDDYKLLGTFCRKGKVRSSVDDCQLRKCKSREEVYISGECLISDYKEWNIISFDLANEKWGEVEHPCYKEGYIHLYLGVLGSDLSIFCDNATSHVDFWVMKEYGVKQSWTKMLTVNYPFDTPRCDFYLPCFMSNKVEIFFS